MMIFPSNRPDVARLQRELRGLEDQVASAGWAWDAVLSRRVDTLCVLIEGRG